MRYCGNIGYLIHVREKYEEYDTWVIRKYKGDVLSTNKYLQQGYSINDSLVVNNRISIVADPYAYDTWDRIRYAEYMGKKLKVTSIDKDLSNKRLILTLGGVYNGETPTEPTSKTGSGESN